jgi:hypothetical protein
MWQANNAVRRPMYLPPDWVAFTHPEGKPYFCRNAGLRVVTEAYLYHPEMMNKVSFWTSSLEKAFQTKGMKLSTTTELFLEPRDDMESCGYYLVDHATRTEFWINPVSTALLGVGRVTSISHLSTLQMNTEIFCCIGLFISVFSLETALEQLYWAHVEFFPMHLDCISYDIIEQLISVFAHGQTGIKLPLVESPTLMIYRSHDLLDINFSIRHKWMYEIHTIIDRRSRYHFLF